MQPADELRALFEAGIAAVGGEPATYRACQELTLDAPVRLLAFGKAAAAMTRGARKALGDRLLDGLVITKHGHLSDDLRSDQRLACLESSHPVPAEDSLTAGQAMLDWLASVRDDEHLIVLVSGGGSSLVEALQPGMDLAGLRARTDELLSNGAPIGEINRVRRGLSRIKGGRALQALGQCRITQLLISDVPGDRLADIASGPFIDDGSRPIQTQLIASNAIARHAVAAAARQRGFSVIEADGSLDGDVAEVAQRLANGLPSADREVCVFGGEPTLSLPAAPGRGGRNQHLAAMLSPVLAERDGVSLLVCGTDGTDGPTDAAGGYVDSGSVARARASGADLADALERADAGPWLEAAAGLVKTGPTGTNVMDLAIAMAGR